ncbi:MULTISPECIES: trifunctional transcriptional regulator/proline dehydrogenase/L-glutamate gamma-semialdehyde dehydrogenase [Bartonella]|uniref:trifunctional transcriptional regulator/proline dehydrogenase/L-glutamate gamma-semialdehyde dehydrogenase n=4 Tax=Bartonellaceae TaxID=772 RepID=UPI0018DCE6F9|nr:MULTISPECIES: trifunctional transcriptional regulator/proline dehydrogenase/L-glutamate gamma-semialdehyde dehydrogenase [Bartonella]MBH9995848.1 trifunctional transcriptional regulator/proline dehydrogenase/L-glutamate gamma-semialdehyde dehydrogenase [Bartonella sp. P0291]MBH9998009.1 trifunctional transcriptional regulator/proline dehydrogenase/L-glutamate gamma-semialdehyde dehydrogenase [Bartonella sp. M0192]MBI0000125.1 trifunctional transcriptional regulator/proline dehydrogenase/L-glu
MTRTQKPFAEFAPPISKQSELRKKITAAYRRAETECLKPLLDAATIDEKTKKDIAATARHLIETMRAKYKGNGVEGLVHEYSLSSQEGVALMCLAEALLRIPDKATRDALIRDKVAGGDWKAHLGGGKSLFVNAATWGLVVTGKLSASYREGELSSSLTGLIARCGEPVIRKGMDMAMRMMGEQFVRGQTIDEALERSKPLEARGFRYSYDMLGEAATTADDADRYYRDYEMAIHAIGKASNGRGVYEGPGISIKLSALHPRYFRSQADRVMGELMPRVKQLALLCKNYNIGLNIDAEEADRLELSLDIMDSLCFDPDLDGWNGIGFVVQAYGRRCPFVLDYLIDLARRSHHRLMVRLVKGAYWDAEIKRAQVDGLQSFPVYTRKVYTDVSYVANARKLLSAPDAVFPQFATHNAQTMATIYHLAGPDKYTVEQFEFQCLHGMGEPLYDEVVGKDKMQRPARLYAPVGTHETLLAYLVRRLLENGANSSFVNRITDKSISVDELVVDPVDVVRNMPVPGAQHDKIASPDDLFGKDRRNSDGYDLSNETVLAELTEEFQKSSATDWKAAPANVEKGAQSRKIANPGDHRDKVGEVIEIDESEARKMVSHAEKAFSSWAKTSPQSRAGILEKAADLMQARMPSLLALAAREAGKSIPNSIAEVREAIDFLRFYAGQLRTNFKGNEEPLGPIVCISPWNFPLSIFIGQISAALAAGNTVLAKPAEETPLIAAEGVRILHEAGIPKDVLQFCPGDGKIGAALIGEKATSGVMFTGSTEVARLIQKELSTRLNKNKKPIPLIAETGGQNAMIVDSSALAEQVVGDVIASAFDSAGQRCSALRALCLQEEVADRILDMLKGAMQELRIGRTDFIGTDIGAVITEEAKDNIETHIETMRAMGHKVTQVPLPDIAKEGTYVSPTLIEIDSIGELKREVFGPVLHVVRYKRKDIEKLINEINSTGYGLTFGLHTRLDDFVDYVSSHIRVGNIYINRNIIGAVVGSQPFGGRGLSGTGPKAGGPLYIGRLVKQAPDTQFSVGARKNELIDSFVNWLQKNGDSSDVAFAKSLNGKSPLGVSVNLPGPVGESNVYSLHSRGKILLFPQTKSGLYRQLATIFATGNVAVIDAACKLQNSLSDLPEQLIRNVEWSENLNADGPYAGALIEGDENNILEKQKIIAALSGPIILTQAATSEELTSGELPYNLGYLSEEVSTSVNTAAAGGNASLMTIG